jgi:hypothetical protein
MNFEVGAVIRVRPQNLESPAESLQSVKPSGIFDRFPDFRESIDSANQEIGPEI